VGSYTSESDFLSSALRKSLGIASAGLSAGPSIIADQVSSMILRSVGDDGLSQVAFLDMKETFPGLFDDVFDIVAQIDVGWTL